MGRSREIGWNQEDILLYEISKKLDRLIRLRCCTETAPVGEFLLMEDGNNLLDENGNPINLE